MITKNKTVEEIQQLTAKRVSLLYCLLQTTDVSGAGLAKRIARQIAVDKGRDFYAKAYEIIHAHGKQVAVHVDGKLKGAIKMMRDIGADCIDAVTPGSVGGCTAAQAREEAGRDLILSGGIPNELWYSYSDISRFEAAVKEWLALKDISPALIAAAGDQVPPGAEEARILRMGELVEEFGTY